MSKVFNDRLLSLVTGFPDNKIFRSIIFYYLIAPLIKILLPKEIAITRLVTLF